jgi:hypothetical protein
MAFHPLAEDETVLVVVSIGERVDGIGTLEADGWDIGEIRRGHLLVSLNNSFNARRERTVLQNAGREQVAELLRRDYGSATMSVFAMPV